MWIHREVIDPNAGGDFQALIYLPEKAWQGDCFIRKQLSVLTSVLSSARQGLISTSRVRLQHEMRKENLEFNRKQQTDKQPPPPNDA